MVNMMSNVANNLFNMNMAHEQMAYNSPMNQMRMMIQAGINPNLAASGISGSPASAGLASSAGMAQMPNLGELYGNSANRELNAPLIQAMEKYYNSLEVGQNIDNQVNGDSSVMESRKQIVHEDLRKRIADANISVANATIIEAEADYAGVNAYHNALILFQRHENLVKEFDRIESEIKRNNAQADEAESRVGVNVATARKLNAEAAQQEWLNDYREKNGYDKDDPLWIKYEELMKAGKYDEAEKLLDNAVKVFKNTSEAEAAGNFEGSHPANKAFATVAAYKDELQSRYDDLAAVNHELDEKYKNKELSQDEWNEARKLVLDQMNDVKSKLNTAEKDYKKGLYITGKPTFWQDMAQQAPSVVSDIIQSVVGISVAGKVAGKVAAPKSSGSTIRTYHDTGDWSHISD